MQVVVVQKGKKLARNAIKYAASLAIMCKYIKIEKKYLANLILNSLNRFFVI